MTDFIIIDDDPINNLICTRLLELTIPGATVRTFTHPEEGLDYILSTYRHAGAGSTILFLDINMPLLNGWEVLNQIEDFPDEVKEKIKIFMLSSSVIFSDQEMAANNQLVSGYLVKPLSQDTLKNALEKIHLLMAW